MGLVEVRGIIVLHLIVVLASLRFPSLIYFVVCVILFVARRHEIGRWMRMADGDDVSIIPMLRVHATHWLLHVMTLREAPF